MEIGGNEAWKNFWIIKREEKGESSEWRVPPSQEVLEERYGGEIGEEYKERLSCRVEGRDFAGLPERPKKEADASQSPAPGVRRNESPAARTRKEANEAYFARMGNENASRPEGVAPSQGGKYAGFGSEPAPSYEEGEKTMPGVDEFQKDPVAALTKGFGWFTSTVGKGAKNVNDGWVKPTAQKVGSIFISPLISVSAARWPCKYGSGSARVQQNAQKLTALFFPRSWQKQTSQLKPVRPRSLWDRPSKRAPKVQPNRSTGSSTKVAMAGHGLV